MAEADSHIVAAVVADSRTVVVGNRIVAVVDLVEVEYGVAGRMQVVLVVAVGAELPLLALAWLEPSLSWSRSKRMIVESVR